MLFSKKILNKVIAMTFILCLMVATVNAAQINTIIDTGSGMFAEPEKVYEEIDKHVKGWFGQSEQQTLYERLHSNEKTFKLIPAADSDAVVQIYREEKGSAMSMDMIYSGMQNRDITMTREDLEKLSEELGADYIAYFRVTSSMPTYTMGMFSAGQKTNVTTDFRIYDKVKNQYVFAKRYQTTGSSSTVMSTGFGSAGNAVKDGLIKALKEIDKDKDKILASVL